MHDHASWSLYLGRWGGVRVRLHMFFLIFAAFTFFLSYREGIASPGGVDWTVVYALAVLLVSVVLHEAGHVWVASRFGVGLEQVVLGPLGGMDVMRGLRNPAAELMVYLGGPIANFLVCLACLPLLVVSSADVVGLLHPLEPRGLGEGGPSEELHKLAFWINWGLMLVNLLPAFPFDGGAIARSILWLRWPEHGRRGASLMVGSVAKVLAVGLMLLPFVMPEQDGFSLSPRFALVLLGILVFFSAQHEERREMLRAAEDKLVRDVNASPDLDTLERAFATSGSRPQGPMQRWLERRREIRRQRRQQVEEQEEHRVDEILARLHQQGMKALSSEDRAVLDRVSARYRSRLQR